MQGHTIATPGRCAVAALLVLAAGGAGAASFDCAKAKSPTEHAICTSPRLSVLDDRLSQAYERALHALSPEGAAQLKESQRQWLRYAPVACTERPEGKPRKGRGVLSAECLEHEFDLRVDELNQAALRIGPWLFTRVDRYLAQLAPNDDELGQHPGVVTQHVAYPQIDAPRTPATIAWNKARVQSEPGPADTDADAEALSDEDGDYSLGCVGDRFVSVETTSSEYAHGTPHGMYGHEVSNSLLVPTLRKMTAADLFTPSSGWKTRLPALFWDVYRHQQDAVTDMPSMEEAIRESAANPDAWLPTPQGLQISFDAGDGGCYACNPGPITVPWTALKPMLATPEFASCKAPAAAKP